MTPRWLAAAVLGSLATGAVALDMDPRYGRESLGYVTPAIAERLRSEANPEWKRRVAQDVSVWMGARTYTLQVMAKSRFKPGFNCLTAAIGKPAADAWLTDVVKMQIREKGDMDRWSGVNTLTEAWPEGPAEDCTKAPNLLHK